MESQQATLHSKVELQGAHRPPGSVSVDSAGRGLGFASSSELDLPERMRTQRKGSLAPPRLSQDPISLSIEEELKPRSSSSSSKSDSAFSRFGRAFRRKSKTGSDLRGDPGKDARDVPPLPKMPRKASSQKLPLKPSDPFAEKALKASSGFIEHSLRQPSSITDLPAQDKQVTALELADQTQSHADAVAANANPAVSEEIARNGEQTVDAPQLSLPVQTQQSNAETTHEDAQHVIRIDEEAHTASTDFDKTQLTTDSMLAPIERDASSTSLLLPQDPSKRPTSIESSSSGAHRNSLAFLASAISTGAIVSEADSGDASSSGETPRYQRGGRRANRRLCSSTER